MLCLSCANLECCQSRANLWLNVQNIIRREQSNTQDKSEIVMTIMIVSSFTVIMIILSEMQGSFADLNQVQGELNHLSGLNCKIEFIYLLFLKLWAIKRLLTLKFLRKCHWGFELQNKEEHSTSIVTDLEECNMLQFQGCQNNTRNLKNKKKLINIKIWMFCCHLQILFRFFNTHTLSTRILIICLSYIFYFNPLLFLKLKTHMNIWYGSNWSNHAHLSVFISVLSLSLL